MSKARIAILGWGSLIWDKNSPFDEWHDKWLPGGPAVKLEFSRISKTRNDALTLVIDKEKGEPTTVAYALSTRSTLIDAICDLRCRESTVIENIGYYSLNNNESRSKEIKTLGAIASWARKELLTYVVCTDLSANFEWKKPDSFVTAAIKYIHNLPDKGKEQAAEYVWMPLFLLKLRYATR